jgi:zinc transport system substrate-binding protein
MSSRARCPALDSLRDVGMIARGKIRNEVAPSGENMSSGKYILRLKKPCAVDRFVWAAIWFFSISTLCGCSKPEANKGAQIEAPQRSKPIIIAVSYPLEYLTQRIAGEVAEVRCPVPPGQSGNEWKPNRDEILTIQSAHLVVANGIGARYAKWLELVSIPANKICESARRGLALRDFIEIDDVRYTHSHGNEGEHSHPTTCAYTWLDPQMSQKQAKVLLEELSRRFPEHAEAFSKRYGELVADLNALSDTLREIRSAFASESSTVVTANPELKFLTRACGWDDVHLKWFEAPAGEVALDEWNAKMESVGERAFIRRGDKTLVLSTYPFPEAVMSALESASLTVVVIDKMDVRPTEGDYLSVMQHNLSQLK